MKIIKSYTKDQSDTTNTLDTQQGKGWIARSFSWVSSKYSSTVGKVSQYVPKLTLNQAASALVVASYIGGGVYAFSNLYPKSGLDRYFNPEEYYDIAGGAAIAMGLSMAISSVMTTINFIRGKKEEAALWAVATVAAGLPRVIYNKEINSRNAEYAKKQWHNDFPKIAAECQPNGLDIPSERINRLDCSLLEKAKGYLDNGKVKDLTRSKAGKTGVYFPNDVPVVIKENHHDFACLVERMENALKICQKNGYQHIAIAKATYYKGHDVTGHVQPYVVQSRLPIPQYNGKQQIGLYLENKDLFTDAIKEFTGFLCQGFLDDLIGPGEINDVHSDFWPRFDNVAIYLEKKDGEVKGKIALPDLDHFSSIDCDFFGFCYESKCGSSFVTQREYLSAQVKTAVRFFPYHMKEIIAESKKFFPDIENQRQILEQARDEAINSYDLVYRSSESVS